MTSTDDTLTLRGYGRWELHDDVTGELLAAGDFDNLVTAVGGQMYGKRAVGITSPPAAPTGMKLGTGTTAPAVSGAGSALATYLTNSHQALDSGFPAAPATSVIAYQCTFGPGKGTATNPITEVVLVNEALTDATSAAAATVARALLSPAVPSKTAAQTLTVTWNHAFPGAA